MVLADGMVHFLKIEKILTNLPKLSCGFNIKLPYFGLRKQVTKVTFLVKEQNMSVISTDVNGISCLHILPSVLFFQAKNTTHPAIHNHSSC